MNKPNQNEAADQAAALRSAQTATLRGAQVERSPLVIACEQTNEQKLQAKMDELFSTSPRIAAIEPITYQMTEAPLKPVRKIRKASRRIKTNSAAGRSKRMEEFESTQLGESMESNRGPRFSSKTLRMASMVAVLASFFRLS
ncbi:MAG: hypothetical protein SGJ27_29820 [Candidatus Melainabacteria bacterium]|nr:hypothetical protein [Candidatus Melainabacteria bacterium]